MATSIQRPLAEYLGSTYRPDCDYVDGEVIERNVGERDHSRAQMRLSAYLFERAAELGIHVDDRGPHRSFDRQPGSVSPSFSDLLIQ